MRITITNMGPVRRIAVDLRDLTVFTGPNNSGKSVVSTVLYAALDSMGGVPALLARAVVSQDDADIADELDPYIGETARVLGTGGLPDRLGTFLQERVVAALVEFGDVVLTELERAYGAPAQGIRRKKNRANPGSILIESSEPSWSIRIDVLGSGVRTAVVDPPSFSRIWSPATERMAGYQNRQRGGGRTRIARLVVEELLRSVFEEFPETVRYLPAARSGMMQAQKVLAGTLLRQSAWAGVRDVSVPGLSGVASDFLGEMVEVDTFEDGALADLGEELEEAVLAGEIVVASDAAGGGQELLYRTEVGDFPIPRTSSMVSELAPIVLLLKHALGSDDMLIVEEPEAHLHPEAQVEFAKILVKVANRGVKLLLTTHSEFFVQQLTNAIAASALDAVPTADAGHPIGETILAERVSAYWFAPTDNGVAGESLTVTAEEGIPDPSFSAVAERLYNQYVRLEIARDESA